MIGPRAAGPFGGFRPPARKVKYEPLKRFKEPRPMTPERRLIPFVPILLGACEGHKLVVGLLLPVLDAFGLPRFFF